MTESSRLEALITSRRLIVMLGEGGVGKTGTAAALAIAAARSGRNVGVLTIDPAPRLGDALGVAEIGDEPARVDLSPYGVSGSLEAMRLDVRSTFDRLVEEFTDDTVTRDTILLNPIYRAATSVLGGTDNYMAFQRLHELIEEGLYDLVVLDTPPAYHAHELLGSPALLTNLLDSDALSILTNPASIAGKIGGAMAKPAVEIALAVVERIVGRQLVAEIQRFVASFAAVVAELSSRAEKVHRVVREDQAALIHVLKANRLQVENAVTLRRELKEDAIDVDLVVANRLTPATSPPISGAPPIVEVPEEIRRAIDACEFAMADLRKAESEALAFLESVMEGEKPLRVDDLGRDIGGLDDLVSLSESMFRAAL